MPSANTVEFVKVEGSDNFKDLSSATQALLDKLSKVFIARGKEDNYAWLYDKDDNDVIDITKPLKKLTKLEYAKLSRPGSIIHAHNEKVENESYNNDTLWIESCKINDVYNTNEPKVKQNRTNAKKVGCIDAGEFKLRDLKRMSIGEIIDLMMFSFAKPSGYEVSLKDGKLIITENFYTSEENEHAQYEEPRIIYIMDSDGSIKSSVSADKLDPVTHKSYDLTIKENGTDITVAPSNLYNIEVYNYNDKIYPLSNVTIPNNEIWYTTLDGETTETIHPDGIDSLKNSMGLTDNIVDGDHCVMKFSKDVTSIEQFAFDECSGLTSITIPNSVTSIEQFAFNECSGLTSITIPNSVTSIGDYAFAYCSGLTSITIGNSVTSIREGTFVGCSGLTSVTIPESVTSIAYDAFNGCTGLTSVTIPESVTSIESHAFEGCSGLTSITIPNSVTSIDYDVFYGCSDLTSVTINSQSIIIAGYLSDVFGNQVSTYIIGDGVTSIGSNAFYDCTSLTSVTIPNSVTNIGDWAFFCCTGLTSVTIPNSVTEIGYGAFGGCTGLTSITCDALTPPTCGDDECFNDVNKTIPLYVPEVSTDSYKVAKGWKYFFVQNNEIWYKTIDGETTETTSIDGMDSLKSMGLTDNISYRGTCVMTFDKDVTDIENGLFWDCPNLISVTMPNSVTSIRSSVFSECPGLTSITIPNSVTSIGEFAFSDCSGLTSITIPNSVTSIESSAFCNCSGLESIIVESGNTNYDSRDNCNAIIETASNVLISGCKNTFIPNTVTVIGVTAFEGCSGLTSITIPNSVTRIAQNAFAYCSSLTSITIPNSVTDIINDAFLGCTGLTSITIPNSVKSIENYVFWNCTGLTSITIPESVTSIGRGAFDGCSSLTSITYNGDISQWNAITKGDKWGDNWKSGVPASCQVHCTNGNINI